MLILAVACCVFLVAFFHLYLLKRLQERSLVRGQGIAVCFQVGAFFSFLLYKMAQGGILAWDFNVVVFDGISDTGEDFQFFFSSSFFSPPPSHMACLSPFWSAILAALLDWQALEGDIRVQPSSPAGVRAMLD